MSESAEGRTREAGLERETDWTVSPVSGSHTRTPSAVCTSYRSRKMSSLRPDAAASMALIGDVNIAEPGAKIGFTGPRVIKQATYADLPHDFQTAEFQLEHGQVDTVVARTELRSLLAHLLDLYTR